jgi:hypothetical protein
MALRCAGTVIASDPKKGMEEVMKLGHVVVLSICALVACSSGSAPGGGDDGQQGASCPCSNGFCENTGSGSGCSASLQCVGDSTNGAACRTPCDSDAAAPSCPSGTSCTIVVEQSVAMGSWCE